MEGEGPGEVGEEGALGVAVGTPGPGHHWGWEQAVLTHLGARGPRFCPAVLVFLKGLSGSGAQGQDGPRRLLTPKRFALAGSAEGARG